MYSIQFYKDKLKQLLKDLNVDCDDIIIINPRDIVTTNTFPTFKDIFDYFISPYKEHPLCPGGSSGPIKIAPVLTTKGESIGYYEYGIERLQYRHDTINISLTSYVGDIGDRIYDRLADMLFKVNLDTKELMNVEVIHFDHGISYKYQPSTYILDPLVISRGRSDLGFIGLMRVLEEMLKSHETQ